jgi:methionine salvage enolase-phosphatase E1
MRLLFKDENVASQRDSPNIRSGRFLWMDEDAKRQYLKELQERIARGDFFRETIVTKIVDEIAPVLNEYIENGLTGTYS